MELKTAFSTIIGILMMSTVIVAIVAMLGGMTNVIVEECRPAEYAAETNFYGLECGTNAYGNPMKCDRGDFDSIMISDLCIDEARGLCCPLYSLQDRYEAKTTYKGEYCGRNSDNDVLRCDSGDSCVESINNICAQQEIRVIDNECCEIVEVEG